MRTSAVPVLSFGIAMMMQSAALAQTEVARGLSASATMLASYEDNVFRSLDGVAAGRKSSDFRITPSIFARYDLPVAEIGRASCRDSVCQYVSISVVAVSLNKKTRATNYYNPPSHQPPPNSPTPTKHP